MLIGFPVVMDAMGITTLLLSSCSRSGSAMGMSKGMNCSGSVDGRHGCASRDVGEAVAGTVLGNVGVQSCNSRELVGALVSAAGSARCRQGKHCVGCGMEARPRVLFCVMRLCVHGAFLIVLGAVGLLDRVGSTLGVCAVVSFTLGGCLLLFL